MMQSCSWTLSELSIGISCNVSSIIQAINIYINHSISHSRYRCTIMFSKCISTTDYIFKCSNIINIDYCIST